MKPVLDRRAFLGTMAGSIASGLVAGCADFERAVDPRTALPIASLDASLGSKEASTTARVLGRATFGADGSPWPVDGSGLERWIRDQCAAPVEIPGPMALLKGTETWGLRWRLNSLESLRIGEGWNAFGRTIVPPSTGYDLRDVAQSEILRELEKAAFLRAAYSRWQLRERLADFWSDHFNIYARKVVVGRERRQADVELLYLLPADRERVVRRNVFGPFERMLAASMRSAAMLGYLDNHVNRKGVPNENYARELMELHSLGVDGGYTQRDVREVARCLTGWTIEDRFGQRCGAVRFAPEMHDDGEKFVLGTRIPPGGGSRDADQVLALLVAHPATPRFVARKLVARFHGPGGEVDAVRASVEEAFRRSSGDLAETVRALFVHPEFARDSPVFKRPFDYVVSAVRASGAVSDGDRGIQEHLEAMGQPLHQWPMPDGYPIETDAWATNLLPRWNFAADLASNRIPGTRVDTAMAARRLARWNPVGGANAAEKVALALSDPDFQWT